MTVTFHKDQFPGFDVGSRSAFVFLFLGNDTVWAKNYPVGLIWIQWDQYCSGINKAVK